MNLITRRDVHTLEIQEQSTQHLTLRQLKDRKQQLEVKKQEYLTKFDQEIQSIQVLIDKCTSLGIIEESEELSNTIRKVGR